MDLNAGYSFFDPLAYYVPLVFNTVVGVITQAPEYILAGIAAAFFIHSLLKFAISSLRRSSYNKLAREARKRRDVQLDEFRERVSHAKAEVMDAIQGDPEVLRVKLQKGEISALDAVVASLHLCLEATQEDNSVTGVIAGCISKAKELDAKKKRGEKIGYLFGMPFSVKENFSYEGDTVTLGVPSRAENIVDKTAVLTQVWVAEDAIPIVRTNVPQTLLTFECSNPLYGETHNPRRRGRTCGGSSGGEASLHARYAVPFGLGSDVGGSLRIPAHFCGTSAFKPTTGRLSSRFNKGEIPGQVFIVPTPGPMAPTVGGVLLGMRAFFQSRTMQRLDPTVIPMPLDESVITGTGKLRIGVFDKDDEWFFPPTHACYRAVEVAREILERRGHEAVVLPLPNIERLVTLYYSLMAADNGDTLKANVGDNPIDKRVAPLFNLVNVPQFVHDLVKYLPQNKITKILAATGQKTVKELWDLQAIAREETWAFLDLLEKNNIDAVLFPSNVMPAALQGHCSEITPTAWPTFVFNMLNVPAGVVPVTRVSAFDDEMNQKFYKVKDAMDKKMKAACFGSEGLPVTVQVLGPRFKDEVVLRVMKEIDDGIRELKQKRKDTAKAKGEEEPKEKN